jgi:anaerobic magnesium-protoporphyrin IX monomethyl ester cyclase
MIRIGGGGAPSIRPSYRALIVDLNNFSTFPTLAVGILISSLRAAGHEAQLLSPLAHDVPAAERERAEWWLGHAARRIHHATMPLARVPRDLIRGARYWWLRRPHPTVLREVRKALASRPDVLLLSAYLQHHATVIEIGRLAQQAGVPLLLGGPAFNLSGVSEAWRSVPGLTAIYGGEADVELPKIVQAAIEGNGLLGFPGIVLPDGRKSAPAPPLRDLSLAPVPDFSDFPWQRYPVRIIPLMTGRGCQWAKCTFCSDVVSVNGRSFRSRSLDAVLHEMREQSGRHDTRNFLFLDLKLNSNPSMLRGIAERAQSEVPGAQWIGTVHVDQRADNGVSRSDLKAAAAGGMRRISFGLETGSQRLLDLMQKGSSVEANAEFIRNAHDAGLSVRCTMFKGFPGETVDDLQQTAAFLEKHGPYLDRVRFNDFSVLEDTPIWKELGQSNRPGMKLLGAQATLGRVRYENLETRSGGYRRAKARVLAAVFAINRRKLRAEARAFDGMM